MADSNIAGLPTGAAITDTDLIAGSDAGSGTLVKKTGLQFNTYIREMLAALPTSDPHVVGALWNNGGVVAISFPLVRSLAGSTGAYALTGSTAMFVIGNPPIFQVDFTAIAVLPAEITLSRASAGTYFDSSGVLQTAAIDAPRFDHDPATLVSTGFLIEESRTNLFLTSTVPANQTITVANATSYTVSFYGTGSLTLTGAVSHTVTGSSATVLTSYTFTSGTTSLVVAVAGSVVYPNVEAGAFATSHIITAGTPVTRSEDIASLVGSALTTLQGSVGSGIIEFTPFAIQSTTQALIFGNGGTPAMRMEADGRVHGIIAGIVDLGTTANTVTASSTSRAALAWQSGNSSLVLDGGTVDTAANTFTISGTIAFVGHGAGNSDMSGHVRSMAVYDIRLPDAALQTKSVVGAIY